jgi:large subunit ribosomal protein L29
MKIKDIRQLSDEELASELGRLERAVYDLRAQAVTEKLADSSRITKAKRDIARCLTTQNQRAKERAAASKTAAAAQ